MFGGGRAIVIASFNLSMETLTMLTRTVHELFVEHPATVDETYLEHLRFAGGTGLTLVGAGLAAIAHGLFPRLFESTASTTILKLAVGMRHRFPEHPVFRGE